MAKNVLCQGPSPLCKCSLYSKYLLTRKIPASTNVPSMYSRCLPQSFIFNDAHAITIVTDELMRMIVLMVPSGTIRSPCGHSTAPTRSRMYVENSAPNSITSDARNNQMPSLPLASPESGRGSTVYGISMLGALRFELRREVAGGTRHAVLGRAAIHDRLR